MPAQSATPLRHLLLVLLMLLPGPSPAAGEAPLYPWEAKRLASVPSPASFLGYELGSTMVTDEEAGRYLAALAASSDRVRLFDYARSYEGRTLRYAVISSSANLARLAEARAAVQRLSSPAGLTEEGSGELIEKTPAFVWLSYSVHGNEHSSTEAALAVAYHLASGDDARTRKILDGTVVFIDPIQNPDGRARFIQSCVAASGRSPVTDPAAAEHDEPWPSGRFNHDLFDLNRDWFFQTQPEVRGRVAAFLAWRPQIFVDFHEMGTDSTYYFAPPARPLNSFVSATAVKWFRILGASNARMFDSLGFEYFTHEVFDLFYPGYGDSWPTLNGAIGMTYEEAGTQGLAIERKDGTILTLRDAIRRHVASSLATVETAAERRKEILGDFTSTRREALQEPGAGPRDWVIPGEPDRAGAAHLATLLASQGLTVLRASEAFSVRASSDPNAAGETRRFPAGSFIAHVAQPGRRLLSALLERDPAIDGKILAEAKERRRLKQHSPFYDVTSWALPLATDVPVLAAMETPHPASTPLVLPGTSDAPWHLQPPPGRGPWPPSPDDVPPGGATDRAPALARADLAYLMRPGGNGALAAFASFVREKDLAVQVTAKAFTMNGIEYAPGTAILRVQRNPESLHDVVAEASARFDAPVEATSTGLAEEGIDLGSSAVVRVKMPRIAVAYGEPASPPSVGALLYVAGERYGLPLVPVRAGTLVTQADLGDFDVVVLPDGSASGYREAFGKKGLDRIRHWMEEGGTLVTFKGASALAVEKDVNWTSSRLVRKPRSAPLVPSAADRKEQSPPRSAGKPAGADPKDQDDGSDADDSEEDEEAPDAVPGAVLRVLLEPSQPLAFGYTGEVPVLISSNLVFSLSKEGVNAGVFAEVPALRMGGFLWPESADLLAGTPYVLTERVGKGTLVLFADDPDFRGGWDGLNRMLLNALLLVPAFEE